MHRNYIGISLFVALVTLFSSTVVSAQSNVYLGGSGNITIGGLQIPGTPVQIPYKGGNGKEAIRLCALGFIEEVTQTKTACYGVADGAFEIKLRDVSGNYRFWWPSLGISKDDLSSWPLLAGASTLALPSAAMSKGFATADDKILYVYSVVNSEYDSVVISVQQYPELPNSGFSAPTAICDGSSFTVAASITGQGSYCFSNSGSTCTPASTATSATYTMGSLDQKIYLTVKDANGCVSSTSVTVTANEPSSIELSSAAGTQDQTVCEKTDIDPVQYTLGGSADGYVLTGALPAGVTHGLSGSVITISGNPKPVEYGAYTYTITTTGHAEPCPAATITGTITVNRESTITLSSLSGTRHQTICEGLAITDVQYTLGGSADDYMITGLPNGVTANLVAGVITLSGTPEELGTFNYTLTTSGHTLPCPPAVTNGSIIVNPLPSITSFTTSYPSACEGGSVDISATASSNTARYSFDGGITWDASNSVTEVLNTLGDHTYTLALESDKGCTYTDNVIKTVTVYATPKLNLAASASTVCYDTPAGTLTATLSSGTGTPTYTWFYSNSEEDWTPVPGASSGSVCAPGSITTVTNYRVSVSQPFPACEATSEAVTVGMNTTPPAVMCPADITTVTMPHGCTTVLDAYNFNLQGTYTPTNPCAIDSLYYIIAGATTVDGPKSAKQNPIVNSNVTFEKGTSTVTYVVKDAAGLTGTCSFNVTVNDNEVPSASCEKTYTVYLDEDGQFTLDPKSLDKNSSDNCTAPDKLEFIFDAGSKAQFSCADLGNPRPVMFYVKDESGNESSNCGVTVTTLDTLAPVAVCKPYDTVRINVNATLTASQLAGKDSYDNCSASSLRYYIMEDAEDDSRSVTEKVFGCSDLGAHTIYVGVADTASVKFGKMAVCSAEVEVIDTTVPQMTCVEKDNLYLVSGCTFTIDADANTQLKPVGITTACGVDYTLKNNITNSDDLTGQTFALGSHTVVWTVTDDLNNVTTCEDTIVVLDAIRPTITNYYSTPIDQNLAVGSCTISVSWTDPAPNDNCSEGLTIRRVDDLPHTNPVDLGAGTHTLKYVAEDGSHNVSDTAKIIITVRDDRIPVIVCHEDTTLNVNAAACVATVPEGKLLPEISNVCVDNVTLSYELSGATVASTTSCTLADGIGGLDLNVGHTVVTYTVTNFHGTTNSCTFTVFVKDTIKPVITPVATEITCGGTVTRDLDADCKYTVQGDEFDITADDCTPLSFTTNAMGATTTLAGHVFSGDISFPVIWTVTDTAGNVSSCSFTLNLDDKTSPVFTQKPAETITVNTGTTTCDATLTDELAVAYADACSAAGPVTFTYNATYDGQVFASDTYTNAEGAATPTITFRQGVSDVEYNIEDFSGNTFSYRFKVDVKDVTPPEFITCLSDTGYNSVLLLASPPFPATQATLPVTIKSATTYYDNCGVGSFTWSLYTNSGAKLDTSANHTLIGEIHPFPDAYPFPIGESELRYTVEDAAGLTAVCTTKVKITDGIYPVCEAVETYTLKLPAQLPMNFDPQLLDAGSSDNSGSYTFALYKAGDEIFDCDDLTKGFRLVNLTVKDAAGNLTLCGPTNITIVDEIAPVAVCKADRTIYLPKDGTGRITITAASLDSGDPQQTYDNCTEYDKLTFNFLRGSGSTATYVPDTTFRCDDAGNTYALVVAVTDLNNNTGTCTVNLAVADTIKPRMTVRGKTVIPADKDKCSAVLSDTLDPVKRTTICNANSLVLTNNYGKRTYKGMELPVGKHEITWTLVDGQNNTTIEKDSIIVVDKQKPDLKVDVMPTVSFTSVSDCEMANEARWTEPNEYIDLVDVTLAVDNCTDAGLLTWKRADELPIVNGGTILSSGTYVLQYVAIDEAGNRSDTLDMPIIVHDETPPVITPDLSGTTVTVDINDNDVCHATLSDATKFGQSVDNLCTGADSLSYAWYKEGEPEVVVKGKGNLLNADMEAGVYHITFTAVNKLSKLGQTATSAFTLVVNDTAKPVVTCPLFDDGEGVTSSSVTKYTLRDNCGYTVQGAEFDPVSSSDNCSSVNEWHSFHGGGTTLADTTLPVGVHDIVWTVTDQAGNSTSCNIQVTVKDTLKPEITCKPGMEVFLLPDGTFTVAADTMVVVRRPDVCGDMTFKFEDTGNAEKVYTCSDAGATHNETIVITSFNGNDTTCVRTITVTDTVKPVLTCPTAPLTVSLDVTGKVTVNAADITDASDACTPLTYIFTGNNKADTTFACEVGTFTLNVRVTDANNNTAECSRDVAIDNPFEPGVTVPSTQTVAMDANECTYKVQDGEFDLVVTQSYCGVDTMYHDYHGGGTTLKDTLLPVGAHSIIWTVIDNTGNESTYSITVTVEDQQSPVIDCPDNVTVYTPVNACIYTVSGTTFDPVVMENCSYTLVNDVNATATLAGATYGVGATTVTWTVTDNSGRQATCATEITVEDITRANFTTFPKDTTRIELAPEEGCERTVSGLTVTADDACGLSGMSYTIKHKEGEITGTGTFDSHTFNRDTTVVTYRVEDVNGNTRDSSFVVIIQDVTPPALTNPYPGGRTVSPPASACTFAFSTTDPVGYTDNCAVKSLTWKLVNSGNGEEEDASPETGINQFPTDFSFRIGFHGVLEFTATDASGNTTTCSYNISINDNIPPICESITTYELELEPGDVTVLDAKEIDNGSSSGRPNCPDIFTYTLANPDDLNFTCDDIDRIRYVRLKVLNEQGLSRTCDNTTAITVVDNIVPTITCMPTNNVYLEENGELRIRPEDLLTAMGDNCTASGNLIREIKIDGDVDYSEDILFDCAAVGQTYMLNVQVTDEYGNSAHCMPEVTVLDTIPPVLNNRGKVIIPAGSGCVAALSDTLNPEVTYGNCPASYILTNETELGQNTYAGMVLDRGEHIYKWKLVDEFGNETIAYDTLIVKDLTGPQLAGDIATLMPNLSGFEIDQETCKTDMPLTWNEPETYMSSYGESLVSDNCTTDPAYMSNKWRRVDDHISQVVNGEECPAGIWTIQYVTEDEAGNVSDTLSFTITVTDNVRVPSISDCPGNKELSVDNATVCYATLPDSFTPKLEGLCTDNSYDLQYSYERTDGVTGSGSGSMAGLQLEAGSYSGTYTVYNNTYSAHSATCNFTIVVEDVFAPQITAKDIDLYLDRSGSVSLDPGDVLDSMIESCTLHDDVNLEFGGTHTGTFGCADTASAGIRMELKAIDASGNIGSAGFTVYVKDNLAPEITLASAVDVYLNESGEAVLSVQEVLETIYDNCTAYPTAADTAAYVTLSREAFDCTDARMIYQVTVTVRDRAGNVATDMVPVTVKDTIKPVVQPETLPLTVYLDADHEVTVGVDSMIVSKTKFCGDDAALDATFESNGGKEITLTCDELGENALSIKVADGFGNYTLVNRTLTVVDSIAPKLICPSELDTVKVYLERGGSFTLNLALHASSFTTIDISKPQPCSNIYTFAKNGRADSVVTVNNVAMGPQLLTVRVTGENGLFAECSRVVTVYDTLSPVIECKTPVTVALDSSGRAALHADDLVELKSVVAGTVVYTFEPSGSGTLTFDCDSDIDVPQTYTLQAEVNNDPGRRATCEAEITLNDTIKPMPECKLPVTVQLSPNRGEIVKVAADTMLASIWDNCGTSALSYTFAGNADDTLRLACADLGVHTYTVRVTDAVGNSRECEREVTVADNTAPVLTAKDTLLYLKEDGTATITPKGVLLTLTDNCTDSSFMVDNDRLSLDRTGFGCDDIGGTFTLTLSAEDISGNTGTATFEVMVADTVKPKITCADTVLKLDLLGGATITAKELVTIETLSRCEQRAYI